MNMIEAEIERLRRRNAQLEKLNQMTDEEVVMNLKSEIERKDAEIDRLKAIITKLCDAMERQMIYPKLVQRAREATR
jgi:hypothetical protein